MAHSQGEVACSAKEEGVLGGLPAFNEMTSSLNFTWGKVDGKTFCRTIEAAYGEAVHWRRNVFSVPSGKVGKSFVAELARLWRAYGSASALECVALQAGMVMCMLLLQKPYEKSKSRDHVACSERRMKSWSAGEVDG